MHKNRFLIQILRASLILTLSLPRLANCDEPSATPVQIGDEIEEPIGEIVGGDKQCFDRDEWATMGNLITHYHWIHPLAGAYLVKNQKQAELIGSLKQDCDELVEAQYQILEEGDNLRVDLEIERRRKRVFAWLAGAGAGVSVVLGLVLYGVAK